jgi:CelD/BcsL family acetyltransferase involved in cellulose biosynthesis
MTGYDPALARFSPGTVATYLVIEDLFRHNPPNRLSFGYGNQEYKREFGASPVEVAGVLLLRKTPRNWARRLAHASYRGLVYSGYRRLLRSLKRRLRGDAGLVAFLRRKLRAKNP